MRGRRIFTAAWTFPLAFAQSPLVITVAVRTCPTNSRPSSLATRLPTYSSLPYSGSGIPTILSSMQPPPTQSSAASLSGSSYLASSVPSSEDIASFTQFPPPTGTVAPIPFPSYGSGDNFTSSDGNSYMLERDTSLSGTTIDSSASGLRKRQLVDPYNALMDCVRQCDDEPACVALTLLGQSCLLYGDVESTSYLLGAQAAFNLERFTGFVEEEEQQQPTSSVGPGASSSVAGGGNEEASPPPFSTPYISSAPLPATTENGSPSAHKPSTSNALPVSSSLEASESEIYLTPTLSTDRGTAFTPPPPTTSVLSIVLPVTLSIPGSLLETSSSIVSSSRAPALSSMPSDIAPEYSSSIAAPSVRTAPSSVASSLPVSSRSESPLVSATVSDLTPPSLYPSLTNGPAISTREQTASSSAGLTTAVQSTSDDVQSSPMVDEASSSPVETDEGPLTPSPSTEVVQISSGLPLPTSLSISAPQEYSRTSTSMNLAASSSPAVASSLGSTVQSNPVAPSSSIVVSTISSSSTMRTSTSSLADSAASSSPPGMTGSSSLPATASSSSRTSTSSFVFTTTTTSSRTTTSSTRSTSSSSSPSSSRTSLSSSSSLTTSSSTRSAVPSATPVRNNGKRGLCYTNDTLTKDYSLSGQNSRVSWGYNYYYQNNTSPDSTDFNPALTFVPLLFNDDPNLLKVWPEMAQRAIDLGADSLLGFNEPDLCYPGSACMTVNQSVIAWRQYMEPFAGKARLGAPAVTNGGPPSSLQWLGEFMGNCTDCTIDFVPIHWYSNVYAFSYLQYYVQLAYNVTQKPIWITEFGIDSSGGSDAQIQGFLQMALPWLDAVPYVERYAYFYDGPGFLIKQDGSGLSAQGQIYNSYTAPCPNWQNTQGHC